MEPKRDSCDQKLTSLSATFIAQDLENHAQIFYTIDSRHYHYQCRINELHGRRIRACFYGWVTLSNHPDNVLWSLWNPLTSKLIRLPPLTHREKDSYECCLSSPPDDRGSVFLLLPDTAFTIVFCRLERKRKRLKWIEMSYAKHLRSISGEDDCFLQCITCCNGKVYAMALKSYMFVIQIDIVVKGKEVVISLLPFVKIRITSCNPCPSRNSEYNGYLFLKGSAIDLFYIYVGFYKEGTIKTISDVYLYKLDMTSMTWKETVELEDATFFLEISDDYSACYYSSAVDSQLGGYIHILYGSSKLIYSFHTKDNTMSLSSMSSVVRENYHASAWAMLDWRLEIDPAESKQKEEHKDDEIVIRPIKGDKAVFDSTTDESHLLNMPSHILELIMECCIGVEYMRFRATCKHCYLAAPSIQWSSDTGLRRLHSYSLVSPWLMVFDNYRDRITFIDPICGERYFIKTPQQLKDGYKICCSRYGWLLMYKIKDGPRLMFFNPFTSDMFELPGYILELPEVYYMESFCFSAPPTSPDCMVVGFSSYGPWNVFIHCVSRESTWSTYGLNFGDDGPYSFQFPAFRGRDIYALCNNGRLEAFRDITHDDFSWEGVANEGPRRSPAQYFLSNCDQHLLLVIVGEFGESVEVFQLNESTAEWVKIDGLGKHMIYISAASCICLEAKLPEMENKIYFPRLSHDDDTKIVLYSLETCRYHTFDDKNIQESLGVDLFGTKHHCYPHSWIEPSWS